MQMQPEEEGEVRVLQLEVKRDIDGRRLDAYLASRFPDYSRTIIQRLIRQGQVRLNGRQAKGSSRIRRGDSIEVRLPELAEESIDPEDIPLDVIYEDEHIVVVNKAPHIVVHPSRGHVGGTMVNALAHHCSRLSDLGGGLRPGIVHRLDRETSGVILFVKSRAVHEAIASQFEKREVSKEYVAVAHGVPELDSDLIDLPLGKDLKHPERVAVRHDRGRESQTIYHVTERFDGYSCIRCAPKTGRTHQIRVHLKSIRHPIVADKLYSDSDSLYRSELEGRPVRPDETPLIERQALHAARLTLYHPGLNRQMTFEAPLHDDMRELIDALRRLRPRKTRK